MGDGLIERIERAAGVPGLVDVLAERLSASDLQSLLLAVHRRRAAGLDPAEVMSSYARNRFVTPAVAPPGVYSDFDLAATAVLDRRGYAGVELSPVSPFGSVAAVATVDQNNVLSATRATEVVADSTNALALECAVRRRSLLRTDVRSTERVRLFASHRLVRGQFYAGLRPHFRLLGLVTAGHDEGSFRFETDSLLDQLGALLDVLTGAARAGYRLERPRVAVTELDDGRRTATLRERVLDPLADRYPEVEVGFDPDREGGRGYYVDACFHVYADLPGGTAQIGDGGFTTWTRRLLGNAKERLLVAGLGTEQLVSARP